jgi:hypothetical protein
MPDTANIQTARAAALQAAATFWAQDDIDPRHVLETAQEWTEWLVDGTMPDTELDEPAVVPLRLVQTP